MRLFLIMIRGNSRNAGIKNAKGEFIAFIDDEIPVDDWLLNMYKTCVEYSADDVLGPVRPQFEIEPLSLAIKGGLLDRRSYRTGFKLNWWDTRMGNDLLK